MPRMTRSTDSAPARSRRREDPTLDEARFQAELRRSVEGALTPAEDRLARRDADWDGRLGRICARFGN